VLLDIIMPEMSGLEAASRITALNLKIPILIFTIHESGALANDARRVGALGYVSKSDASRQLVVAIETLLSGGTFFGKPQVAPATEKTSHGPTVFIVFRTPLRHA
jgi:DNA-binding NarL/FixJ family response regulator